MKYLILLLLSIPQVAWTSGTSVGTRGGGNLIQEEFFDLAQETLGVLSIFRNNQSSVLMTLKTHLPEVKVLVSPTPLYLEGFRVIAINDPSHKTIEIDEEAWVKSLDLQAKRKLVIHELLGALNISDSMYNTSREFIANYRKYSGLSVSSLFEYLDESNSFFINFKRDITTVSGLKKNLRYLQMNYSSSSVYAEEYCVLDFHKGPILKVLSKGARYRVYGMTDSRFSLKGKSMAGFYIFLNEMTLQCLVKKDEVSKITLKDFYDLTRDHIEFSMEPSN